MATGYGTNQGSLIDTYFTNPAQNFIFVRCLAANIPNAVAGYATGCVLFASDTGLAYTNTGSATSCTFTQLTSGGGGGGLSIPFTETDNITTTGVSIGDSATGLTSGAVFQGTVATGVFTTGGSVFNAVMNAVTAGNGFVALTTGAYTGTGLLLLTANSATTGTIAAISATGLTTGKGLTITTSTGMTAATGAALNIAMGAGIGGQGINIVNSGAYTDVAGIISVVANTLTTGGILAFSATSQTSATLAKITGGGSGS